MSVRARLLARGLPWPDGIVLPEVTDDHVGKLAAWGYCYEPDLLLDMMRRVSPGSLALDVGAHIGNHTIWLAGVCDCRVMSFEPVPELAEKLQANVSANGLDGGVEIIRAAVSDRAGHGRIVKPDGSNSGQGHLVPDPEGDVEVITIDSLGLTDVDVIKIDVEHHEMRVLDGADETIDRCSPLLYVEGEPRELWQWMVPRGYKPFGKFAVTYVYGYRRRT